MTAQQIIPVAIYVLMALSAGAMLVMILGATLHAESRFRSFLFPAVFPVVAAGIAVSVLLSGRNLAAVGMDAFGGASSMPDFREGGSASATWPLRFATLYILAASFALILGTWARREKFSKPGSGLIVTFFGFFFTNVVLNSAFGTQPYFLANHYYPVVVFLAAYLCREQPAERVIMAGKAALLLLLLGSLTALGLNRDLVLQQPYVEGWVPKLNVRLWGLASHANSIGPLALLYLLLEIHTPFKNRNIHLAAYLVSLAVIVLAQSKTVWVAGILLAGILYYFSAFPKWRLAWRAGAKDNRVIWLLVFLLIFSALSLAALLFVDLAKYFERFGRSVSGQQLFSLTGRSEIWAVAIRVWEQNPMFGYGPKLWDPAFRQSIGMNFAFHAHNQFLQSLSSAGTLGLLGTVSYMLTLAYYSLKFARQTAGLTLVLWMFLFIRCVTEIPLSTATMFNGDFLIHALTFAYLARVAANSPVEVRRFANQPASRFRSA